MSRKPADHPNEYVQRRINHLRKQIASYQSEVARLVKEGRQLRKAARAANVAAPLPRRRAAEASQPPP